MSVIGYYCPQCAKSVTWSKPRHSMERFIRNFTPFSPCICMACGWRGWKMSGRKLQRWRMIFIALLMAACVFAMFLVLSRLNEKLAAPPSLPKSTQGK